MTKDIDMRKVSFVLLQLALAAVVCVLLFVGVFIGLKHYTQHGQEVEVPDILGLYIEEAQVQLEPLGLIVEVVDSTYNRQMPLGTIVDQNPLAGSHAKHGRHIYVTQNARTEQFIVLPSDLRDISRRQAEARLNMLGLVVDSVVYEPSEYNDLVLDVCRNGESLVAGDKLSYGTKVQLVVGKKADSNNMVMAPNLVGLTLNEARQVIRSRQLVIGALSGEKEGWVYKQNPKAGTMLSEGKHIDLSLSMEEALIQPTEEDDEEFF